MIPPTPAESLSQFDTCTLADAVEWLGLHADNQGFTLPGLRCFAGLPKAPDTGCKVGYAATARIRSGNPPVSGHPYIEHPEWWSEIGKLPTPRIVVLEDSDKQHGVGACIGRLAAAALQAMGCVAAITNGSCRDIEAVHAMGFGMFAAHASPSRSYSHIVEHSKPVTVFGLRVSPGDLLAADCHGVLSIPQAHAAQVCTRAAELVAQKRSFVDYCRSAKFSIDGMQERLRQFHS